MDDIEIQRGDRRAVEHGSSTADNDHLDSRAGERADQSFEISLFRMSHSANS